MSKSKAALEKYKAYIGKKYHRLEILDAFKDKVYKFKTLCECGKITTPRVERVFNGETKSCGCYSTELASERIKKVSCVKPNNQAAFNKIYNSYRSGAKRRSLDFELDVDYFKKIVDSDCSYCGEPPSRESKTKGGIYYYNGIDRVDNTKGYLKGNCTPCCTDCNFFKSSKNSEEFVEKIYKIFQNLSLKQGINLNKLDEYYNRALTIAQSSPDEETKVGAILIHKDTGAVISSGYNGFVRGADDKNLPKTRPEKYDYMVHAEANLLYNCARHGVSTNGCVVFCTLSPCISCCRFLYQAGIRTIYFKDKYRDFQDQISMKDLQINLTQVGKYYKLELEANNE